MEVIGVPFDLCGKRPGSRLGPAALRLANLIESISSMGIPISDGADIPVAGSGEEEAGLKSFGSALECVRSLKARVLRTLERGDTPLVIGGDHFMALGSVSAAMERHGDDLAVLWVDAHADLNTPFTSPSGNLHGMPFGALLGLPSGVSDLKDRQWRQLTERIVPQRKLASNRAAWYGLRELDRAEQCVIGGLEGCFVANMHDIDRHGAVECLSSFEEWLSRSGARRLWISFDVDVLDPSLAPGTGTAVRGGLTYREMHIIGELLHEMLSGPGGCRLAGLDVVEVNPLTDTNNITALTVVEWIASLFGKRIMGSAQ